MKNIIKKIVALFPKQYQQELKRIHYSRQIKKGVFNTGEIELELLKWDIRKGDWILDIGANIGQYTLKFSEIVGDSGRVIAFEPVPETFELLSANVTRSPFSNMTLMNVAVSDATKISGMLIPKNKVGLNNYYQASLTNSGNGFKVMCLKLDNIELDGPIKLVKIDAEGHEFQALKGMENLIKKYKPSFIVEGDSKEVLDFMISNGYKIEKIDNSPNCIFRNN